MIWIVFQNNLTEIESGLEPKPQTHLINQNNMISIPKNKLNIYTKYDVEMKINIITITKKTKIDEFMKFIIMQHIFYAK